MTDESQLLAHIFSASICLHYIHDFPRFQTVKHCRNTSTSMQAAIATAELNEQATMLIEIGHYDAALDILEFAMNTLRRRQDAMMDITPNVNNTVKNGGENVHQEQSIMELDEIRAILMYNMALSYQLKASNDIASNNNNNNNNGSNFRKIRMFLKSAWKLYQCSLRGLLLLDDKENEDSYYGGRISVLKMNCDQILKQLKLLEENANVIFGASPFVSSSQRVPL